MGKFKSREKMLAKVIKSGCYKLEEKENEANRKLGEEDDASAHHGRCMVEGKGGST